MSDARDTQPPKARITISVNATSPAANDVHPVHPTEVENRGNINASIEFNYAVFDVYARVYDGDSPIYHADEKAPESQRGLTNDGTLWTWDENGTGFGDRLPNVLHSSTSPYPTSTIVFWWKVEENSPEYESTAVTFTGSTAT